MLVREILRVKGGVLYTISPTQSLSKAIETMADLDAGSLVVMDAGKMVGLLTFREVMSAMKRTPGGIPDIQVGEVMVRDPVTAYPEMDANDLRRLMIEQHSRYLPVVEGTQLLGVISFLDVAKAVLEEQSFENQMLKNYIKHWPGEPAA
ncbi:MAG: CBS domain-containing protein [Azonexus sp.]|nr:CBS domain-containing protein [Azonexus sp.]